MVTTHAIGRRECCWALLALGALATVDCVSGSRGMSGGSMVSSERERALGREAAGEVERTTGLVKDAGVTGYVRDVGARLIRGAAAQDGDWTFGVLDDDELNAFSLPGGYVYVSRGLLALLNTENELAGVMAHEVGHVVAHHGMRRATAATPFALLFGVPAAALGVVSPDLGGLVAGAGKLAGGVVLSPYSREQEREADRLGMELSSPTFAALGPPSRPALPHPPRPQSARLLARSGPRSLTLAPLHPRLDREPAAAQDHWGPAGALDADPRLRPLDRAVPGPPPGPRGRPDCLEAGPPAEVALIVPMRRETRDLWF